MTATLPWPLVVGLVAPLGLAIGSFLNVVVHRVPLGLSVVHPPSACPQCRQPVRGRDNVPVLSWLLLRGRCRDCRTPISVRYPLVEAGTAALLVAVALRLQDVAVALAVLPVAAAGVALALALPGVVVDQLGASPAAPLWELLVAVAAWVGVYGGAWLLTGGRGMGLGDVALAPVLAVALGALGLGPALVGLMAGFVLGALVGGLLLATGRLRRGARLPHGPFMLLGAAVGLFAGDPVTSAYLSLTGLA
ncbi:MAG: prepilin peptidase [Actinobacteria bacterium]|nr:prepilin peptidase [Actinomycetota bacterium]